MEAVVFQSAAGQALRGGRVTRPAKCAGRGKANVVEQDNEYVRRPYRRSQRLDRWEFRIGVLCIICDQPCVGLIWNRQYRPHPLIVTFHGSVSLLHRRMYGSARMFCHKLTDSVKGFELSELTAHLLKLSGICICETAPPKGPCFLAARSTSDGDRFRSFLTVYQMPQTWILPKLTGSKRKMPAMPSSQSN